MATPYDYQNSPYNQQGFTYGGAAGNGLGGSLTPKSLTNAAVQANQGGGGKYDPHAAFGNAGQKWAQYFASLVAPPTATQQIPQAQPAPQPMQKLAIAPTAAPAPAVQPMKVIDQPIGPDPNPMPEPPAAPAQPPAAAAPPPSSVVPPGMDQPVTTHPGVPPSKLGPPSVPTPPGAPPPAAATPQQVGPKPTDGNNYGLSDWAWSTANDWYQKSKAQGYGDAYAWLLDKPWVLDMYKQTMAMRGETNVDPVDWIHSQFPELANPGYKRAGYDTWLQNPDGTTKGGYGYNASNTPPQMSQEELQKANAAATPMQYGSGYIQQLKSGIDAKTIDPKSLPDDQLKALGYTPEQIAALKQTPASGAPSAPGTPGQPQVDPTYAYLRSLLNPGFQQEQDDFLRKIASSAATTGAAQSGAYLESQSRGLADLMNAQGSQLAGYSFQGAEAQKQRALEEAIANIQARANVSAAQAHAAGTTSAAQIAANANRYSVDQEMQRLLTQLPYQDKWQGYGFQLGEDQLGANYYQYLLGLLTNSAYPPPGILPNLPPGQWF